MLKDLLDPKIVSLLSVISKNKSKLFHLTQLSDEASVPSATTFRLIKILLKAKVVNAIPVGKLKIYQYNDTDENGKLLQVLKL